MFSEREDLEQYYHGDDGGILDFFYVKRLYIFGIQYKKIERKQESYDGTLNEYKSVGFK